MLFKRAIKLYLYRPRNMLRAAFAFLLTGLLSVAHAQQVFYLIGDAGEPTIAQSTIPQVIQQHLSIEKYPVSVLFLGDNIYPKGLPAEGEKHADESRHILQMQVDWVKDLPVTTYFIPGNHDWHKGGRNGWTRINQQQAFLDSLHLPAVTLFPRNGCPGPVSIPLGSSTVLVIIDTQWLLHPWDKPGEESDCACKSSADVLNAVRDVLVENQHKRVIVAAHHPIITYGEHGGVAPFRDHIFPLRKAHRSLYVPLPVVGSIYPLYRRYIGNIQDTAHPVYRQWSQSLESILREFPGSIYVSGHEHALEYIRKDSTVFIVSGTGSKTTFVKQKKYAAFASGVKGFARLEIDSVGAGKVTFIQVDAAHPAGKILYESSLTVPARLRAAAKASAEARNFPDTVRLQASRQYHAGQARTRWLGANYRQEWETPVSVPVFDIRTEQGGLTILQKGGGMQTLSLRLADSTGREWVLRSVEKYPEHAVPENLRNTFAEDLVQDQISAAHPYGALVIASLADAAGIYHTNPRLVFIPDDPALGIYRKDFANRLALFEERPDGDARDQSSFGNSEKIISTTKVLEKLQKDVDNRVDEEFTLRSRLFDLWIGDWDRHDDQWRWASFGKKKKEVFRPIPRDRDQAFFVNEGRVPRIWSRKWALPKFEGFDEAIDWVPGLAFNARYFDRSFLTSLTEEQWRMMARELQQALTDEVIEGAIRQWPPEIASIHGDQIIRALKKRRDDLEGYAISLYQFLARTVSITGSDQREWFEVASSKGSLQVTGYKLKKSGERGDVFYTRVFKAEETKEVRLYGLAGDDRFVVSGKDKNNVRVRIIGGAGSDSVRVSPGMRRVWVYDEPSTPLAGPLHDRTDDDPAVNVYDRKDFQYNRLAPLIYGNFNPDDGLFLGGGVLYQDYGFRKQPYRQRHIAVASVAPATNSYNFIYRGDFTQVLGRWNAEFDIDVKSPNFVNNFFGLGNQTKFNRDIDDEPGIDADRAIDYYRFRFEEIRTELKLHRRVGLYGTVEWGGIYQQIEIEEPHGEDRFVYNEFNTTYEYNRYAGARVAYAMDHRDSKVFTRRGILLQAEAKALKGLTDHAESVSSWNGSISFYQSFRLPARVTYALRVGGGRNASRYNFYQAQILDGKNELRGFRKTRFYGDSKAYMNNEIRLKLLTFRSYLFPATLGVHGFYDVGRVWYKDSAGIDPSATDGSSSVWHTGFGGGIWFTPFNMTVVSTEFGHSVDGNMVYVRLGFLF
jgi:hypothetical protein